MSKFKLGELCIVVGKPCTLQTAQVVGEVVEVIRVAHWWAPIRSELSGVVRKWDYEVEHADGARYECLESALAKKPPPDAPGSWKIVELSYRPPVKRAEPVIY